MTLTEFCRELGISTATGKNWVRLGKLAAEKNEQGKLTFSEEYLEQIRMELASGKRTDLRSRRNKSQVSGAGIYPSYRMEEGENRKVLSLLFSSYPVETLIRGRRQILKYYAIQQLRLRGLPEELVTLLDDADSEKSKQMDISIEIFPDSEYVEGQDFLGCLYISLSNLALRKAAGAYYTPTLVVQKLTDALAKDAADKKTYLDPCCGTGNFLLSLADYGYPAELLYGQERDPMAAAITRLNLALRYRISDRDFLEEHIRCGDTLKNFPKGRWDVILGNPPWGCFFSDEDKRAMKERYVTAGITRPEASAVFLEQCLEHISNGGLVSFVVPEALLHVKQHDVIRTYLLKHASPVRIEYLGNVFKGVMCPSVIYTLRKTEENSYSTVGMKVKTLEKEYFIQTERNKEDAFSYHICNEEYKVLCKIKSVPRAFYLKGSDFALGIVTGDNKRWLYQTEEAELSPRDLPDDTYEPVLRGVDIEPFHIKPSNTYLCFHKEEFQQVADEKYYRAPEKLVYSFISNRLCFACDREGRLTLNSCNILIPKVPGYSIDYIVALLNSRVLNFYWKKKWSSNKVLRSHLEELPLAPATREEQDMICHYMRTDREMMEQMIRSLYELSDNE